MGIRDFLDRLRSKRLKYKEYDEDMKIQEQYLERRKSANERELERFQEEHRQRLIKAELEAWRKSKKYEMEHSHQILHTKNMFEGEKHSLLKNPNIFKHKQRILGQKRLFAK